MKCVNSRAVIVVGWAEMIGRSFEDGGAARQALIMEQVYHLRRAIEGK
jgi:hypothetical protein